MRHKDIALLEAKVEEYERLATEYELKAIGTRHAIELLKGTIADDLPAKIEKASQLLTSRQVARPKGRKNNKRQLVRDTLASGPQPLDVFVALLSKHGFDRHHTIKFLSDLVTKRMLQKTGARGQGVYALSDASRTSLSATVPIQLPQKMTARQKKMARLYVIWRLAQASNGRSLDSDTIMKELRAAKLKAQGQIIGAAIRYGTLRPAPDSTRNRKRWIAGTKTAADFPGFTG